MRETDRIGEILTELPTPALITDPQRRIVWVNRAFERVTGFDERELLGRNCDLLQGEGTDPATVERIRTALGQGRPFQGEILNFRRTGEPFWNSLAITPVRRGAELVAFASVQFDVTARVAARVQAAVEVESAELYRAAAAELAAAGDVEAFSSAIAAAADRAGARASALLLPGGGSFRSSARPGGPDRPRDWERLVTRAAAVLGGDRPSTAVLPPARGLPASLDALLGEYGASRVLARPLPVDARPAALLLCALEGADPVVVERLERLAELGATALGTVLALQRSRSSLERDHLTGLLSRSGLQARLEAVLAEDRGSEVCVVYADVDRFKRVNDSFGHAGGDAFLQQVADRLAGAVGASGVVGRPGGDEFVVLFPDTRTAAGLEGAVQRVVAALRTPFTVQGRTVYGSVSLGRAVGARRHAETAREAADRLVHAADVAMFEAKRRRQSRRRVQPSVDPVRLESDLHHALERDEIETHFQPQFDCATGRAVGYEALARWNHREFGWISPAEFVPLAEETGMISEVGLRVLQQSSSFAQRAADRGPLRLALNVSVHQLVAPGFVDGLADLLAAEDDRRWQLVAEIAEPDLAEHRDRVGDALVALSGIGVVLSIDGFGTGHSSLALLQDLPVAEVKIDRSFVRRPGAVGAEMLAAIVGFARGLGLQVSADGVETAEQLDLLTGLGCDRVQGFLLAPPMRDAEALRSAASVVEALGALSGGRRRASSTTAG